MRKIFPIPFEICRRLSDIVFERISKIARDIDTLHFYRYKVKDFSCYLIKLNDDIIYISGRLTFGVQQLDFRKRSPFCIFRKSEFRCILNDNPIFSESHGTSNDRLVITAEYTTNSERSLYLIFRTIRYDISEWA